MDTNQQNVEATMKIRVTSRFDTKSFQYKLIIMHSKCTYFHVLDLKNQE